MEIWKVYKHTNKINGKCYIGITYYKNPRYRWGKDGKGYNQKGQHKFWSAICKYGWDNFTHEIIEDGITTPELANEREIYYIDLYDSFYHGYNATKGGSGATGHIVSEEARKINGEKHKGNKNMLGKHHSEEQKKKWSLERKGKHNSPATEFKKGSVSWSKGRNGEFGKSVLQYNSNGNFIKEWPNIYTVVNFFNCNSETCIRQCCKGNRKRYKGYIWRFKEENFQNKIEIQELIDVRRSVLQYDINKNFIKEYESVSSAFRETKIGRNRIRFCCVGKQKTAGGYIWKNINKNNYLLFNCFNLHYT